MSPDFFGLQRAVTNFVSAAIPKDTNKVVTGKLDGHYVRVGNKSYFADFVSDIHVNDGDFVYCLLPDSGSSAAVVGKR